LHSGFSPFKTLKIHGLLLSVIYAYGLTDYIDRSPPFRAWLLCAIRCECVTELNRPYADYQQSRAKTANPLYCRLIFACLLPLSATAPFFTGFCFNRL